MRISDGSSDVCSSDLPSLGLAPLVVKQIFEVIREINANEKMTVLLVEQNAYHALRLAHRGYVLANGRIVLEVSGGEARKSGVWGKSVSVRVDPGGRRIIKKKKV